MSHTRARDRIFKFHKRSFFLILCVAGILGSLNLYVLSLPGFGMGIWPQSEIASAAFNAYGTLAALGLAGLSWHYPYTAKRVFLHPLACLPLLLAVLSFLLIPLADLPVRHVLGSVRTGEGTAQWFSWAMLSASCLWLCRLRTYRFGLALAALISILIVYVLTLSHVFLGQRFTPFYFPDFLGISLVCAVPLIAGLFPKAHQDFRFWAILYLAINFLIWPTSNNAAFLFTLIIWPMLAIIAWTSILRKKSKALIFNVGIYLAPLAIMVGLYIFTRLSFAGGYYDFSDQGALMTVVSRAYLTQVVLDRLTENAAYILSGFGWGTYEEHLAQNLPTAWLDFTKMGYQQWDGLFQDHFHSHNIFVEALYSVGLFGFLAVYFYITGFFSWANKQHKFSALIYCSGIIFIGSMWFFLQVNLGFIILGAAILSNSAARLSFMRPFLSRYVLPFIFLISILIQVFASAAIYDTARSVNKYYPQPYDIETALSDCQMEYNDHGAGGLHLSKMLLARLRYIDEQIQISAQDPEQLETLQVVVDDEVKRINHLFCQSSAYIQENPKNVSIRLVIARLLVRGELLLLPEGFIDEPTQNFYRDGWQKELDQWIEKYPARSDQAIPYLLWHFNQGQEIEVFQKASSLLQKNSKDPIGLWFYGLVLTSDQSRAGQGVAMMREALGRGLERFMPVDEDVKVQLLGSGRAVNPSSR